MKSLRFPALALAAIVGFTGLVTAQGEEGTKASNPSAVTLLKPAQTLLAEANSEAVVSTDAMVAFPRVALASSKEVRMIEASSSEVKLADLLAANGVDLDEYRNHRGGKPKADRLVASGEMLILFKVEKFTTMKKITLAPPVKEVYSSTMAKGTSVKLEEGKPGQAYSTKVVARDSSKLAKVNESAIKGSQARSSVETVTVITPPEPEVHLIGTNEFVLDEAKKKLPPKAEDAPAPETGEQATVNQVDKSPDVDLDLAGSGLLRPIKGVVTSSYGMRRHPVTGVYKLHDGTDFNGDCGDPVKAAAGGKVTSAKSLTGYGNQIAIDHGAEFTTSYSHLSKFAVEPGEFVQRGDIIGYVGTTGWSTGCHLHFMTIVKDKPYDPMKWLKK